MATGTSAKPQNRQGGGNSYGATGGSMDVGNAAVARMAREDTRWFIVAVVVLSLVIFLALPITALLVVDHMKIKAEIRAEIKELKKLKKEVKDVANSSGNRSEPNQ